MHLRADAVITLGHCPVAAPANFGPTQEVRKPLIFSHRAGGSPDCHLHQSGDGGDDGPISSTGAFDCGLGQL